MVFPEHRRIAVQARNRDVSVILDFDPSQVQRREERNKFNLQLRVNKVPAGGGSLARVTESCFGGCI